MSGEVMALLQERDRVQGWIEKLVELEGETSAAVFGKVMADYRERLRDLAGQLLTHRESVQASVDEVREQLARLAQEREERAGALEEAKLRFSVGEFDEAEWERHRETDGEALAELEQRLATEEEAREELERILAASEESLKREEAVSADESFAGLEREAPAAATEVVFPAAAPGRPGGPRTAAVGAVHLASSQDPFSSLWQDEAESSYWESVSAEGIFSLDAPAAPPALDLEPAVEAPAAEAEPAAVEEEPAAAAPAVEEPDLAAEPPFAAEEPALPEKEPDLAAEEATFAVEEPAMSAEEPPAEVPPPVSDEPPPVPGAVPEAASATLGELYREQGHTREAEEIFRNILDQQPGHAAARAGLEKIARQAFEPVTASQLLATRALPPEAGLRERRRAVLEGYLERLRAGRNRDV